MAAPVYVISAMCVTTTILYTKPAPRDDARVYSLFHVSFFELYLKLSIRYCELRCAPATPACAHMHTRMTS